MLISRQPARHATTHQHGGSDEIATATAAANAIPKAGASGTLAVGWLADFVASGASHAPGRVPDPGASAGTSKFLREDATWNLVTDANLSFSDVTTNNVSTSKHGFTPKAPNDTSKFLRGDGSWAVPSGSGNALPRGYIDGYQTAYNSTISISIGPGTCRDSTNAVDITLTSTYYGKIVLTTDWASGAGSSGSPVNKVQQANNLANGWLYVYVIAKTDGTTDILFDDGTPTLPSGYTYYRRIGMFRTNGSSNVIQYTQIGDLFEFDTPQVQDDNASIGATSGSHTCSFLPGGTDSGFSGTSSIIAILNIGFYNASAGKNFYVCSVAQSDAVSASNPVLVTVRNFLANSRAYANRVHVPSSATGAIYISCDTASSNYDITVVGWIDHRGKDGTA